MLLSNKCVCVEGKGTDPKLRAVQNLLSLLPIFTVEVKKADLFEGRTFLVGVKGGGGGVQVVLPLVFSKELLGEMLFRDSGRMRSQTQSYSNLKEMFNDMPQSQTSLDSCLCPL